MRFLSQQGLGLAWLLEQNPGLDFFLMAPNDSPWLSVDFPTGSKKYAIWNSTGSVYECEGPYDAVAEDPIYTPPEFSRLEKSMRAMEEADRQSDAVDALICLLLEYGTGQNYLRERIEQIAPGVLARLGALERVRGD